VLLPHICHWRKVKQDDYLYDGFSRLVVEARSPDTGKTRHLQALGELSSQGRSFSAYYFRTGDRYGVDLVVGFGKELWAAKVKLTSSPSTDDVSRLNNAADIIKASRRFLVSQTKKPAGNGRCLSCDLPTFVEHLGVAGM